jgi:DNA polymerase
MSGDRGPLARDTDPETSHLAAAEVNRYYRALVEGFYRQHDDPERGWTWGEIFDTHELPFDKPDNIWKRSAELRDEKRNPVLEWVPGPDGKPLKREWQGSGAAQGASRLIREQPSEEPASMIDPGLIDEAYKAYQELAVLAPLRAQSPFVPGDGPLNAPVLLVGEAPGAQEVTELKPFVGPAGQLLNKLLAEIGLPRWFCWVTNVVLYRPPGNRTPEQFEIHVSRPRLMAEIQGIDPGLVITLGATARRALMPHGPPVSECHGQLEPWNGRWLLPTYHPSAGLRDPRILDKMRADLAFLKKFSPIGAHDGDPVPGPAAGGFPADPVPGDAAD